MSESEISNGNMQVIGEGGIFQLSNYLYKNMQPTFYGDVLSRPPLMSKRQETKIARREAVRQARHVERYSEHIRGGLDKYADMVVGATLRVHPQPDWELLGIADTTTKKPFALACKREFNNWAYDSRCLCDAEGHYNFGGMMWMALRNLAGPDGETGGVIHYDEDRAARYNHRWATFVTIVDPDRIETPGPQAADPDVFNGKRLDEHGRMVSMFIRKRHPAEGYTGNAEDYEEVPRETAWGRPIGFHWFVKTRGGQIRGITNLVTVLKQCGMLDEFDDSYLGAAVINSVLATYIKSASTAQVVAERLAPAPRDLVDYNWGMFEKKSDWYGKSKIRAAGKRVPVLPPDDEIMMATVNRAIDDPSAFRNGFLREYASAVGISFETLSNNFSEANYSAARASLLEAWRGIMKMRVLFTAHVANLIYGCVIEEAIAKGRIVLPPGAPPFQENREAYIGAAWTGPGMGWIDPQKEANAIKTLLELKVTNRQKVAAERGDDYLEIFDQWEQEQIEAEDRDIVLEPLMPGAVDPNADPNAPTDEPGTSKSGVPKTKPKKTGATRGPWAPGEGDE